MSNSSARVTHDYDPVHMSYNPYFLACFFFSWNRVFLSQEISQQYFSAGLSTQPNGPITINRRLIVMQQKNTFSKTQNRLEVGVGISSLHCFERLFCGGKETFLA
jgi:hypothetical protein